MTYLVRDTRYTCPKKWGKPFWNYMFLVALHTNMRHNEVKKHFDSFACLIPCALCRCHFSTYLKAHPPPTTGLRLFKWVHTLKNVVNERQRRVFGLHKPDLPYYDALKRHKNMNVHLTLKLFLQTLVKTLPREPHEIPDKFRGDRRIVGDLFKKKFNKFISQIKKNF